MIVRNYTISLIFLFIANLSLAQVAWFTPDNPPINDTVVLTFDSNKGNKGLKGWKGDVYFHTGAITNKSIDGGDWKHIIGNWGEEDSRTLMESIGNGLYQFKLVISDFYELRKDEQVNKLAFVFRNGDGSKVGKTANNEDIFLPVNGYKPPPIQKQIYKFHTRNYVSHFNHDSIVEILTDHGLTKIIPYTKNIIQVIHFQKSIDHEVRSEAAILAPQKPIYKVLENKKWLRIITDSIIVVVHKSPFYISFVANNDTILKEEMGYYSRSDNNGLRFIIDKDEKIFGLGERANGLNLVGNKYNLYNRPKYGYEIGAKNLNYSVPLVVSSKKYLLLFDNEQKGYADIGETENGVFEWGAIGGTMKYFIVSGSTYKSLSSSYSSLTGFQPLPPIWALGNLQSRMGYRSQYETDSIADLTIKNDFPLDAMIIDLYWFGDSLIGTMGRLDWYKPNWPDPESMISGLREKGVKTVLITEPYILDSLDNFIVTDSLKLLALDSAGNSYVNREFYFGDGALIDIFIPEAGDWFWDKYKKQMEIGVSGWWGDLGEPENHPSDQIHINGSADEVHNIYAHYWHEAIFRNFRKDYPKLRLFNLNRAGYAGSQRYSIYPWTGDVSRSWGGLKAQIPLMIHMGLCGLPFIHSDAGGFAQGTLDNELYTRWLQMACFSPILRPHGSGIESEPVYFNDTTKNIVRSFMKLRYKLLPYIYTLAAESKLHGYPIVRPLFYEFPEDTTTYEIEFGYMFGDDMLVYPIVEKGQKSKKIYLPRGINWFDFWTNLKYEGGQWIEYDLNLETIPIFIKSGSSIPMVPYFSSTDYYNTSNLTFKYYYDQDKPNNKYTMFVDDGKTFGTIESNNYRLINFESQTVDEVTINYYLNSMGQGYPNEPTNRKITIEIIGMEKSNLSFKINDRKLKRKSEEEGYYYDDATQTWIIQFTWDGSSIAIKQDRINTQ